VLEVELPPDVLELERPQTFLALLVGIEKIIHVLEISQTFLALLVGIEKIIHVLEISQTFLVQSDGI
jgi:hypothetical protein